MVTLTLPNDVVEWLAGVDADLGWAVVKLHDRSTRAGKPAQRPLVELAHIPGQRALILVRPEPFRNLTGVSIIPLADGRGFLALHPGQGVADLEIAVIDRLEAPSLTSDEREALEHLRSRLKEWRQEGIAFESRAIVVAMRQRTATRAHPLSSIRSVRRGHDVA